MIRVTRNDQTSKTTGRHRALEPMTSTQIHSEAMSVVEKGLSSTAWRALDLLFAGGIMTVDQLDLNPRTLRRYAAKRVLDRYAYSPSFVVETLGAYGLQVENGQLYTLGPVGSHIAEIRHGIKPPSGFLAFSVERVLHDVIVNEIVFRVFQEAEANGWQIIWASKYESSIFREDVPILEPDAFIRLERDGAVFPFLIEYHNEDKRTRAIQKVRQYERAWESDLWQAPWEIDEFPPLLAIFRKPIVGEGYKDGIKESRPVGVDYYGRALSSVLAAGGLAEFVHINKHKKGKVFPWYQGKDYENK